MRYYLYLSAAKLDMLYGQIPQTLLRRLAVEAKVDLKVLGVAMQSPRGETTTYDRLDIVENYLEREFDVSWMTEPSSWFRGDLALRSAGYSSSEGPVLMTGREGDTVIALIGSARHLIGQRPAPDVTLRAYSALPALFQLLHDAPEDWPLDLPRERRTRPPDEADAMRDVLEMSEALTAPAVFCDFLARRLLRGSVVLDDGRELNVVVGTPLYVAMADDDQEP
ncbi:DUF7019 family protein [Streptomyces sp. SYP-A7185]|uniref:DUF7019 family protein n=1 Tax=Streptomyces sp. SYP-A7185 TaxID=3040076 RepID=UPI0038F76187